MTKNGEIGALWVKSGAKGEYMTGTINDVRVVLFKNDKEPGSKAPDWRVLLATKRQEGPIGPPVVDERDDIAF